MDHCTDTTSAPGAQATRRRGVLAQAAGATLLLGGALLTAVGLTPASAEVEGLPAISDYTNYPVALPAGCPDGPGGFVGLTFRTSSGSVAGELSQLALSPGDTVTMSWDGLAPQCATANGQPARGVSIAAHALHTATFDTTVDQELLAGWASCGGDAAPCLPNGTTGTGGALSITLPLAQTVVGTSPCRAQVDAVIGGPLALVGPSGSWYTALLRGDDRPTMLVGAETMDLPCVVATTTTADTGSVSPTSETPTTVATTVATTEAPATEVTTQASTAPSVRVEAVVVTASPTVVVTAAAAAPVVLAAGVRTLPVTGSPTVMMSLAGLVLVGAGAALLLSGRRVRRTCHVVA